jgi:hypothetical protein
MSLYKFPVQIASWGTAKQELNKYEMFRASAKERFRRREATPTY